MMGIEPLVPRDLPHSFSVAIALLWGLVCICLPLLPHLRVGWLPFQWPFPKRTYVLSRFLLAIIGLMMAIVSANEIHSILDGRYFVDDRTRVAIAASAAPVFFWASLCGRILRPASHEWVMPNLLRWFWRQ